MLDDGESTSTTSGDDDDEETSSENGEVTPMDVSNTMMDDEDDDDDDDDDNEGGGDDGDGGNDQSAAMTAPSKRIKLSLGRSKASAPVSSPADEISKKMVDRSSEAAVSKLPALKISKPTKKPAKALSSAKLDRSNTEGTTTSDGGEEVKAMIVDSDEAGEDDAIAAVVEETAPKEAAKRRPMAQIRPIRLPSMSSPGMLIPPSSGVFKGTADVNGFATPASVFDHTMSLAGYTIEGRTKHPHRGSSIKRVVGDMFDSNVKFSLHFPKLVPDELLDVERKDDGNNENGHSSQRLFQTLIRSFGDNSMCSSNEEPPETGVPSRKSRKLLEFKDMIPLSLTLPYPEHYIQKRLDYVKKVEER